MKYEPLLPFASTETQRTTIQALIEHGSQNRAAEALGWKRSRVQSALRKVQAHAALSETLPEAEPEPIVRGQVKARQAMPVAQQSGRVARFILTSAQNNTPVHRDFFENLMAYTEHLGAQLMVARFTYNKSAYRSQPSKPGEGDTDQCDYSDLWYDPLITPYICDDPKQHGSCRWQLAPAREGDGGLLWCAEQNILPTANRPLSGLETYGEGASCVFPHAKIALESLPVISGEPRMNYTTGTCTLRNYIARKAGIKAEFHHAFGAVIVEVDTNTGYWWIRHLNATNDGSFYDLRNKVSGGRVEFNCYNALAINWGDVHASEIDIDVARLNWINGGVLDQLHPQYQFWHDTHSHRNRSHHERAFSDRAEKWALGVEHDTVESEIAAARRLLERAKRRWCETVVVSSNHDRHGERWLDEADYKQDLPNAEYFLEAQLARVRAIRSGRGREWDFLPWALRRAGLQYGTATFLKRDQSFRIGPEGHQVECGQHGDEGPNGARGADNNLSKVATRMNKGHSHQARALDGLFSAGVCQLQMSYNHGPSSWSISDILTYLNGKRTILTMRGGLKWAPDWEF